MWGIKAIRYLSDVIYFLSTYKKIRLMISYRKSVYVHIGPHESYIRPNHFEVVKRSQPKFVENMI